MDCSTPEFPVFHCVLEFAQTHVHWISDTIQPSDRLLTPSPPAFNLSQHQGLFQWVVSSHQVAKVFELQQQSFQCISGLISFRIDCFDLLVLQGTLKSVLWHHNSQASVLGCSAFFVIQFSHPYITTRKTIALALQTKMISLLFNMLSRFVIAFLPRRKYILILWLWSPSPVILEHRLQWNKICHCFHFVPIYLWWCDVTGCHDSCFLSIEF